MYNFFPQIYDKFMEYADYSLWEEIVTKAVKKYSVKEDSYLDIGCGTGKLLSILSDRFRVCDGIDISENMIIKAKERNKGKKNVVLYKDDMITFKSVQEYNVITAFFDTVNHILSAEELSLHFKNVYNALCEGGIYIFDIVNRQFMDEMFPGGLFVDDREELTCIWELDQDEGIDYISALYFVKNKKETYDKHKEVYTKKIFSEEEIKNAIAKSGLKIKEKTQNKKIAGNRWIYILKK